MLLGDKIRSGLVGGLVHKRLACQGMYITARPNAIHIHTRHCVDNVGNHTSETVCGTDLHVTLESTTPLLTTSVNNE